MSLDICDAPQRGGILAKDGDGGVGDLSHAAAASSAADTRIVVPPPSIPGLLSSVERVRRGVPGATMAKAPPEDRDSKSGLRKAAAGKQGSAQVEGDKQEADKQDKQDKQRAPAKGSRPATAFDLWLQRELQDMFTDVSNEPLPDELLRLIDESKSKK